MLILPQSTPFQTHAVCLLKLIKTTLQGSHKRFLQKSEPNVHTIGKGFDLIRYNDQEIVKNLSKITLNQASKDLRRRPSGKP